MLAQWQLKLIDSSLIQGDVDFVTMYRAYSECRLVVNNLEVELDSVLQHSDDRQFHLGETTVSYSQPNAMNVSHIPFE